MTDGDDTVREVGRLLHPTTQRRPDAARERARQRVERELHRLSERIDRLIAELSLFLDQRRRREGEAR